MSNMNRNSSNQHNRPNSGVTPFDFGQITLNDFLNNYLNRHRLSFQGGLSYDVFINDVERYVLPAIGKISLVNITPERLRACYSRAHKWYFIPLSVIAGMNRFLEVAFDSLVRPGMYHSNPAAALSAEHIIKTRRKLPYTVYPIVVRRVSPAESEDYPEDIPCFDISVPNFPDICYLGSDPYDGINLVRRFLIDELEVNPRPCEDMTLRDYPMDSDTEIVMVELNT